MVHEFVLCRDYLHDQVFAAINKQEAGSAAGVVSEGVVTLDRLNLLVEVDEGMAELLLEGLPLLRDFERRCGLIRTTITPLEGHPDKLYIRSSGRWMTNTITSSLYTHLIRILSGLGALGQETLEAMLLHTRGMDGTNPSYEYHIFRSIDIFELMSNLTVLTKGLDRVEIDSSSEDEEIIQESMHNFGVLLLATHVYRGDYLYGYQIDVYKTFINRYINILKEKRLKRDVSHARLQMGYSSTSMSIV